MWIHWNQDLMITGMENLVLDLIIGGADRNLAIMIINMIQILTGP